MKTLKIMKIVMGIVAVIGVLYLGNEVMTRSAVIEVTNEPVATTTIEVQIEKSNVEKAREQLETAKKLLNDEESMILAEIDAREDRLEEIREIRLSFTEAPNQQN